MTTPIHPLKIWMLEHEVNGKKMAELLHCSPVTVSNYLRKGEGSLKFLRRIYAATQIPLGDLAAFNPGVLARLREIQDLDLHKKKENIDANKETLRQTRLIKLTE